MLNNNSNQTIKKSKARKIIVIAYDSPIFMFGPIVKHFGGTIPGISVVSLYTLTPLLLKSVPFSVSLSGTCRQSSTFDCEDEGHQYYVSYLKQSTA